MAIDWEWTEDCGRGKPMIPPAVTHNVPHPASLSLYPDAGHSSRVKTGVIYSEHRTVVEAVCKMSLLRCCPTSPGDARSTGKRDH